MKRTKSTIDPTQLNGDGLVLWFDDLGTGNEEFRFLSNFYEGDPIVLPNLFWEGRFSNVIDGEAHEFKRFPIEERELYEVEFPTGEHAFQAMKTHKQLEFRNIALASEPGVAKYLGRHCTLRADWEEVKLDVMAAIVRSKFTLDRTEGRLLLKTGDAYLCEGTFWGDKVWGVDLDDPAKAGRNWLGTLLMARRAELRARQIFGRVAINRFADCTAQYNREFAS